ncbi:oxygen-independent coproporphyrinogen III oxidase [Cellvibrio sp. PSBB006]|uniref:oxygen-independent coproporphyrinogen III oxidase n=1 Tax=Cellvibrio sp. PSBB006 TaxID=1987723 RepID=UPI000B3B7B50|nr:oxygen-independent coproporphyrinogen III oxidase [Cellvibrio sp. PSBB006]ARU26117.1 oxygen-independent coproporphyrinogen III oxidase [Cellvibrio sp. PSBB006]
MSSSSPSFDTPLHWNTRLISQYDLAGPRYTSYPTAPQFSVHFSPADFAAAVERSNASQRSLSLYFHLPFCDTLCFYCGCNKVVTNNKKRAEPYLQRVEKELAMQAQWFDTRRPVKQLHWGGGTPTFISDDEMTLLMSATRTHFNLLHDDSGEYSVEIHPGRVSAGTMGHLRQLGFNRVSMGVQDFDPRVQKAVNRYNTVDDVRTLVHALRAQDYHSISMDLIYGLPLQSKQSFSATLAQVIDLSPDRLSLFNYAHLPHLFKSQALIKEKELPSAQEKLDILQMSIETLQQAGYVYIGMDHFAKPEDSLVQAQRAGKLQRNFQGYSTHGDCDLVAFGVSSISAFGGVYVQNAKVVEQYQQLIDSGKLASVKGFALSEEDHLRQFVINQLICHFVLDFNDVQQNFGINAQQHFSEELAELTPMIEDGLLSVSATGIQVHNAGRLLIRRVCMVFDEYLKKGNQIRYSKVI